MKQSVHNSTMTRFNSLLLFPLCYVFLCGYQSSVSGYDEEGAQPYFDADIKKDTITTRSYSVGVVQINRYYPNRRFKTPETRRMRKKLAESLDKRCGGQPSSYIANGRDAEPNEFPSYAAIRSDSGNCGGTILSEYHILTAAHCLDMSDIHIYVKPTNKFLTEPPDYDSMHRVAKVCISGAYDREEPSDGVDLAIYKLEKPLKFSRSVQGACLPERSMKWNDTHFMIGLGRTDDRGMYKNMLQVLPALRSNCPADSEPNHSRYICPVSSSISGRGETCSGDSGGPLIGKDNRRATVFGVLEGGTPGCSGYIGDPVNRYTDTHFFKGHILDLIECTNRPY